MLPLVFVMVFSACSDLPEQITVDLSEKSQIEVSAELRDLDIFVFGSNGRPLGPVEGLAYAGEELTGLSISQGIAIPGLGEKTVVTLDEIERVEIAPNGLLMAITKKSIGVDFWANQGDIGLADDNHLRIEALPRPDCPASECPKAMPNVVDEPKILLPEALRAAVVAQARPSKVTLQLDRKMVRNRSHSVHLIVDTSGAAADGATLAPSMPTAVSVDVKVAASATATIEGNLFTITPLSDAAQITVPIARWQWNVVPKEQGTASLIVGLRHQIFIGGKEYTMSVRHFPQEVTVDVMTIDQVKEALAAAQAFFTTLQGALTALAGLVTLVGGWYFAFRKKPS